MKVLRNTFFCIAMGLVSQSFAQERGNSFSPNYQGWFYLRTQFTGDQLSLEGNEVGGKSMNGGAFMSPQKGVSGTLWKFVPDAKNKGWYRLQTKFQGSGKCLEGNNIDGQQKNGVAFMDNCQDVSGQLWRLELVSSKNGDHLYRLHTKFQGDKFSLEGNKQGGSKKGGNSFMDNTQNVSGQLWRLVPAK